uniref:Securin n=1 Tax=Leptobrachium leishanense TaxID=445787 RepID=A0A8C5PXX7_9ANUR
MATMIFMDQENSASTSTVLKNHLLVPSSSVKGKIVCPGKIVSTSSSGAKLPRKALGNVNQQVTTCKATPSTLQQKHLSAAKKMSEVKGISVAPNELYPDIEIENFFPYDPSDFESFDLPEDHKLGHLCLAGVGLVVQKNDLARFKELTEFHPAPMEVPSLCWESDSMDSLQSFLASFNDPALDMPDQLF